MVTLGNPDPRHPKHGEDFTITASDGTAPYTFKIKIDDNPVSEVTNQSGILTVPIPEDAEGEIISILVIDGNQDRDGFADEIL
jgi:hypothetical protein